MTSFQAFTCITLVIVLMGSGFSAFSILFTEGLFNSKKKVITYIDNVVWRCYLYPRWDSEVAETNIEYDLEVKVSSNTSEQENTSDNDEPEDAYLKAIPVFWLGIVVVMQISCSCFMQSKTIMLIPDIYVLDCLVIFLTIFGYI